MNISTTIDIKIKAQACRAAQRLACQKRGLKFLEQLGVCERIIAILKDKKFENSYDVHLNGLGALGALSMNDRMRNNTTMTQTNTDNTY